MKMIDPHLHVDTISCNLLYDMATAGITTVVTHHAYPCNYTGTYPKLWNEPITSQTIIGHWERLMNFESWRVGLELIDTYVAIALNNFVVPPDYEKVLEALPKYLERERVVGFGELSLEPSSPTCPDMGKQEEILRIQVRIAKQYDKAMSIHIPMAEKEKWTGKIFDIITEEDVDRSKVVVEHADGTVAKIISEFGCYAGIAVQPPRKVSPADAAKIAADCRRDRVLINSDCSFLYSDPLSVPKTALEMRRLGLGEDEIKTIVFDNPCRVYKLGQR